MIISCGTPTSKTGILTKPRFLVKLTKEIITGITDPNYDESDPITEQHKIDSRKVRVYLVGLVVFAWTDQFGNNYIFDPITDFYISVSAHEGIDFEKEEKTWSDLPNISNSLLPKTSLLVKFVVMLVQIFVNFVCGQSVMRRIFQKKKL